MRDQIAYFAVISCILHGQDKLRSIRGQQVSVLSLIPLLSVQNLSGKQYHQSFAFSFQILQILM